MLHSAAPLARVVVVLAALYAATLGGLWSLGRQPALPWAFLPFLVLIAAPLGVALYGLAHLPQPRGADAWARRWRNGACIVLGLGVAYLAQEPAPWLAAASAVALATRGRWTWAGAWHAAWLTAAVVLGYAAVWNLNYLFAILADGRLHDGSLVSLDLRVLASVIDTPDYRALFPLVRHAVGFKLLENAYLLLFPEVITVALLLVARRESESARWMCGFFTMYAIGLLVFLAAPTTGPPIYDPTSFDPRFHHTVTFGLMRGMATEYRHVIAGGPLSGFGYFVAVPSLHVAAALFMQREMRAYPYLYWTWLPVNTLLILSTVLLGYHYFLDVPAGCVLACLIGRFIPAPAQAPSAPTCRAGVVGAPDVDRAPSHAAAM